MSLWTRYILSREITGVSAPIQCRFIQIMPDKDISEKRTAPKTSSGINTLIAAANKQDRFKLLEDDEVLAGNLENHVHPIFWWFDCDGPMKQMLRLASQFLAHDSLLVFFIPLLYGHELSQDNTSQRRTYLSDPFAHVSTTRRQEMLIGVKEALQYMTQSIEFRFIKPEKRVYARTLARKTRAVDKSAFSPVFQRKSTAIIEIADRFMHFYASDDGYKASSRCAQFRHDFLFASTLVHEIVHAVGVMRRGNLVEPCIHIDDPDPEWGYAWEQFLFGCIINPQDRTKPGTYLLMRKVWADAAAADEAGGKEYSDVPMTYIAQWFRKETWDLIVKQGPAAIPPPVVHFKIQSSRKFNAWVVSTDCIDTKAELIALRQQIKRQCTSLDANGLPTTASPRIFCRLVDREALQRSNVPVRPRMLWLPPRSQSCAQQVPASEVSSISTVETTLESSDNNNNITKILTCISRKRKLVDEAEIVCVSKFQKC